jgi:amino acid transporter
VLRSVPHYGGYGRTGRGLSNWRGLYCWAAKLGGPDWGWFTGWFNLIGQVAVSVGIDYGLAVSIDVLLNAWFPDLEFFLPPIAAGKTSDQVMMHL